MHDGRRLKTPQGGRHYLDHASTSPLRPEAAEAMRHWSASHADADPRRVHTEGRLARGALEQAREQIAGFLAARPREVVLTSGATEAINAAVFGAARARPGAPVVAAGVEHSAVRESARRLAPVVELRVDRLGRVDLGHLEELVGDGGAAGAGTPALVSVQWANHEVGTLQPVAEAVRLCRSRGVLVHVDAAAAGTGVAGVGSLGADLVSISSHKLGGPKGAGVLLVRSGLRLEPLIAGGAQERGRRGGMENALAVAGLAGAFAALAADGALEREGAAARDATTTLLRSALAVSGVVAYGDTTDRADHITCFGVDGVEAEAVVLGLDQAGVAVHSGSACSSEELEPSPVLEAMGVPAERSICCSVGWSTCAADVDAFSEAFAEVVGKLRALAR